MIRIGKFSISAWFAGAIGSDLTCWTFVTFIAVCIRNPTIWAVMAFAILDRIKVLIHPEEKTHLVLLRVGFTNNSDNDAVQLMLS